MEEEEEKMKQSKVFTFREFPYCFFSAKTLQNLLNDQCPLTSSSIIRKGLSSYIQKRP